MWADRSSRRWRARLVAGLALTLVGAPCALAQWSVEVVEPGRRVAGPSSVAIDALGRPVVAYGGDVLRLARWDGGRWSAEEVGAAPCQSSFYSAVSLALDGAGHPGVSYHEQLGALLKFARWDGSAWTVATVDDSERAGEMSSLAFDRGGNPAIAYRIGTGELRFARWIGASWAIETIDAQGSFPSLRFDGADQPRIAYRDMASGDLNYAAWSGSSWVIETVDSVGDVGTSCSLALDRLGSPVIAYFDVTNGTVELARRSGTVWTSETVDDGALYLDLALDGADHPAVSYYDASDHDLRLARWTGTAWAIEVVDAADTVGQHSSIRINGIGDPVISYFDATRGDLKAATWFGGSWRFDVLGTTDEPGHGASLALDAVGKPVISYATSSYDLRVARWAGRSWAIETIDTDGVGGPSSLRIDRAGKPAIAYRGDRGIAKYAKWSGDFWVISTVDTDALGYDIGLVLDSADEPVLAYHDYLRGLLWYARFNGEFWSRGQIDWDPGDHGQFLDLEIDAADRLTVSYQERNFGDLRFASQNPGWMVETVDDAMYTGAWTSHALDSAGMPMIAYSGVGVPLRLARWTGTAWTFEEPSPLSRSGISLALDPSDRPAIASVAYPGALTYTKWDGGVWNTEPVDRAVLAADTTLALDRLGIPTIAYRDVCGSGLKVARLPVRSVLYRGVVADLGPGWRTAALPLSDSNDSATPPFPVATEVGAYADDDIASGEPLTLYRLLIDGVADAGNRLQAVKTPAGVALSY